MQHLSLQCLSYRGEPAKLVPEAAGNSIVCDRNVRAQPCVMRMFAQKLMNRALPGGVENISFRGNFNSPRALIRETKIKRSKKTRSIGGRNYVTQKTI